MANLQHFLYHILAKKSMVGQNKVKQNSLWITKGSFKVF